MVLEKLSKWPSKNATKLIVALSIVLIFVIYSLMGYFFLLSDNPGNVLESQLSFSALYMKIYYVRIRNLDSYRIAETLDYGFMVGYSLLIFSLALTIARKFDEESKYRKAGYLMAVLGFVAAGLDAVENGFILAMLTNIGAFPDIWAIAHSTFALIKWILLIIIIVWAIAGLLLKLIKTE